MRIFGAEEDFFPGCPPDAQDLSNCLPRALVSEPEFSKEHNVQVGLVVAVLVENLFLLEINDLTRIEERLHHVERELAKNWMVVLQTQVRDVYLDLLAHVALRLL